MSDATGDYIRALFAAEDATLAALREEGDRSGLPPATITPEVGRLLQLLVATIGARRVLEVGTLGGYSAIWIARALPPDGRLLSLERDAAHAGFARRQLARAGLAEHVEVRVGRALDLLPSLDGELFDLVFLDADREPMPTYLEWALRLLRPGGLVVADHVLRAGRGLDAASTDPETAAVREFNRRLASDPRVLGTVVAVGDGVGIGVRRAG